MDITDSWWPVVAGGALAVAAIPVAFYISKRLFQDTEVPAPSMATIPAPKETEWVSSPPSRLMFARLKAFL